MRKKTSSRKTIYLLFFIIAVLILLRVTDGYKRFLMTLHPVKYTAEVEKYSKEYRLDPNLVLAVIKSESGFNPSAKSHKNAIGLMQLTEGTARWGAEEIGLRDFTFEDLYEPETNIKLGCWYIRCLLNEFNQDVELAVAAYNGGSGNVKKWLENKEYSSTGDKLDKIPFKETEEYLKKVMKYKELYGEIYNLEYNKEDK